MTKRLAPCILAGAMWFLAFLAAPAAAQTSTPPFGDNTNTLGVTFGVMKFTNFHSNWGFDARYATKTLTEPVTPLGFRVGFAVAGGLHNFSGEKLKLFEAGLHLTADKIGSPSLPLYGSVLFGAGNYFGATDKFMTLGIGADFPVPNHTMKVRVEVAQVWDFGFEVAWRFSGGVALPLR